MTNRFLFEIMDTILTEQVDTNSTKNTFYNILLMPITLIMLYFNNKFTFREKFNDGLNTLRFYKTCIIRHSGHRIIKSAQTISVSYILIKFLEP